MSPDIDLEHRLAVMTDWAFCGGFGLCLVLSGFAENQLVAGLAGFAAFVAAFVAHVVINRIFRADFSQPQIALGLTAYTIGVVCFIGSALFNPDFGEVDIAIGLVGFTALAASFIVYVMINYGVRGSYAMVYRLHSQQRPVR